MQHFWPLQVKTGTFGILYHKLCFALKFLNYGYAFAGDSVADRWKNMKKTFMSNHKKVRESKNKCSGTDEDGIYVPKWHLYKKLPFLEKACVQADSSSNLPVVLSERAMSTEPVLPIYFDENLQVSHSKCFGSQ